MCEPVKRKLLSTQAQTGIDSPFVGIDCNATIPRTHSEDLFIDCYFKTCLNNPAVIIAPNKLKQAILDGFSNIEFARKTTQSM